MSGRPGPDTVRGSILREHLGALLISTYLLTLVLLLCLSTLHFAVISLFGAPATPALFGEYALAGRGVFVLVAVVSLVVLVEHPNDRRALRTWFWANTLGLLVGERFWTLLMSAM